MTSDELHDLIFSSLAAGLINTGRLDDLSVDESKRLVETCVKDVIRIVGSRMSELEAARIAYASEFPPNALGDPDVGSIHANIRSLKLERDALILHRARLVAGIEVLDETLCPMSLTYPWVRALLDKARLAYEAAVP